MKKGVLTLISDIFPKAEKRRRDEKIVCNSQKHLNNFSSRNPLYYKMFLSLGHQHKLDIELQMNAK